MKPRKATYGDTEINNSIGTDKSVRIVGRVNVLWFSHKIEYALDEKWLRKAKSRACKPG